MKHILRLTGLFIVMLIGIALTWMFVPALRYAPICAPAEAWAINHGLIKVEDADWGYLKLRSGKYGLDTLRSLERYGRTAKIQQTAVAVQFQYHAKSVDPNPYIHDVINRTDHEPRVAELRLPPDAKTYPRVLPPGQEIPSAFWRDQRFRAGCLWEPAKGEVRSTTLRMADVNGDGQPEVIVDCLGVGTLGIYDHPVVHQLWAIYGEKAGEWQPILKMRFCDAGRAASGDTRAVIANRPMDTLWLNGHVVNFFTLRCYSDNSVTNPTAGKVQAQVMAARLKSLHVLAGGSIPDSLSSALAHRSVTLMAEGEPENRGQSARFLGLPPCFVEGNSRNCLAIVHDFDHDGLDDVVILSGNISESAKDYHVATLLMQTNNRWQVVANHTLCTDEDAHLTQLKADIRPSAWLPVIFNGRPYLPDDGSDSCALRTFFE